MSIDANVIRAFVEAPACYLATCRDGEPNAVPVGFKWIEADRLLVADVFFGKASTNLQSNLKVAISVGFLDPKRRRTARDVDRER